MSAQEKFHQQSTRMAADPVHLNLMEAAAEKHESALNKGLQQYKNLPLARSRAAFIKWKVTENLDKYLLEFESNLGKKGGKVIWAPDSESALNEILQLLRKSDENSILKSRSLLIDEINLDEQLRKNHIKVISTDFAEFTLNKLGDKAYHMASPVIHKDHKEIVEVLNRSIGSSMNSEPEDLGMDLREELRKNIRNVKTSIIGADFLIADSGGAAIREGEGDHRLLAGFPKILIIIAGIESILPSMQDLDLFWPLYSTYAFGQNIDANCSILNGPKQSEEIDGPEEVYVILLDNGRTKLLAQDEQRQSLSCIQCGACQHVCPVYRHIGAIPYETAIAGPLASVVMPEKDDLKEYKHLAFASTLCGACTEICPVKINLHKHIQKNRTDAVSLKSSTSPEKLFWYLWKNTMMSRKKMNKGTGFKSMVLKTAFKKNWGKREFPVMADKSFNELWRESKNIQN